MDDDNNPVVWVIWGAMLMSIAAYTGLGWFLAGQRSGLPGEDVTLLTQVFGALGLGQAVASYALRPILARGPFFTYLVVRWALIESIGIFGLVLAMLGAELNVLYGFSVVAGALLLLNAPTADQRDRYQALHPKT